MQFFKRELGPIERFETALREKQAARQKLSDKLGVAETVLEQKRGEAGRLAVAGASRVQLDRADANMRAFEDRAKTLRAALAEFDEQVASTERALVEAKVQRDRDLMADAIEAMAVAIEQAVPRFDAGGAALVDAVTKSPASILEATRFAANIEAVRREVRSAADLVCWQLRSAAVRARAGNANIAPPSAPEPEQAPLPEIDRQLIFTLNPLLWREGSEVRRVPAFAMIALPKKLLPLALNHQLVDHLNARRVQTLMHVHGRGQFQSEPSPDDPQLVDLDALAAAEMAAAEKENVQADVA